MSLRKLPTNEPPSRLEPVLDEGSRRLNNYAYVDGSAGHTGAKDSESLSEAWRILGRHKGVILLAALLGAMAAYLVTLPQTPVYRAWSFLEIQNLNEDFLNARAISPTSSPNYQSPDYNIRTQMTILQSRPVIERAINSLSAEEQKLLVRASRKIIGSSGGKRSAWRKQRRLRPRIRRSRKLLTT